jgi:ankyrin repeat protein
MAPSADEQEELLLSARFGEIDDVKAFVDEHGETTLADARDDSGNTILHMTCANGHEGASDSGD